MKQQVAELTEIIALAVIVIVLAFGPRFGDRLRTQRISHPMGPEIVFTPDLPRF
jgi:hypothetical protein